MNETCIACPGTDRIDFGWIPSVESALDRELCCPAGVIRLPLGDVTRGGIHLNAPKRRTRFTPKSPEEYASVIASNYDEIWVQRGKHSLLLFQIAGRRALIVSRRMNGIYPIITAFPLPRDHGWRRRNEVRIWSR
jgi:hypothetical protein